MQVGLHAWTPSRGLGRACSWRFKSLTDGCKDIITARLDLKVQRFKFRFALVSLAVQVVGSRGFLGVLAERPDLYAYLLGPVGAVPTAATHVLAWRPVAAGEGPNEPTVTATVSFGRLPKRVSTQA